jgi:hypothetical protein
MSVRVFNTYNPILNELNPIFENQALYSERFTLMFEIIDTIETLAMHHKRNVSKYTLQDVISILSHRSDIAEYHLAICWMQLCIALKPSSSLYFPLYIPVSFLIIILSFFFNKLNLPAQIRNIFGSNKT